jgi:hypothetical protein
VRFLPAHRFEVTREVTFATGKSVASANCPHKLTKTAGPLARRRAASSDSNCTRASRRLQFAPAPCGLVAAAAVPLRGFGT